MIRKKTLLKRVGVIDGLLSKNETILLYNLATKAMNGVVVEIGSFKGKSTICLAYGVKDGHGVRVYAIDPHKGDLSYHEWEKDKNSLPTIKDFKRNISRNHGIKDYVYPLFVTSEEAIDLVKHKADLIFVDGDHRYEGVIKDFNLWKHKLNYGGVIAFHDSFSWEGVIRVVDEELFNNSEFVCLGFVNSITYFKKVNNIGFKDSIRNQMFFYIRKLYVKIIFMHLPKPIVIVLKKINQSFMKFLNR